MDGVRWEIVAMKMGFTRSPQTMKRTFKNGTRFANAVYITPRVSS